MAKFLATIKAIITRLVFACHGVIAIWQVTIFKANKNYWYLAVPTFLLFVEGFFTLTIKENQEWKWFCPSVFIYLGTVVPAIWLLELHKVEKRLQAREEHFNLTAGTGVDLKDISKMLGGKIHLPDIPFSTETWVTLIEQFLMLTLIVGRWLLPKGDLTRDQLSQLLLVYIGTAADIIEFFDSFKDDKIVSEPLLVLLTLAIWSWSLLQFTVVLTATKSRKSRASANGSIAKNATTETCCCSIDVCAIMMNIALQDAPFLAFRLLIIVHYRIVSYMNVFFTCKNTLVILLQIYRLYVVHSETNKAKHGKGNKKGENKFKTDQKRKKNAKGSNQRKKVKMIDTEMGDYNIGNIAIISNPADIHKLNKKKNIKLRAIIMKNRDGLNELDLVKAWRENEKRTENDDGDRNSDEHTSRKKAPRNSRKDTGYSTASSQASVSKSKNKTSRHLESRSKNSDKKRCAEGEKSNENDNTTSGKHYKNGQDKSSKKHREIEIYSENSASNTNSDKENNRKRKHKKKNYSSNSDNSSSEMSE